MHWYRIVCDPHGSLLFFSFISSSYQPRHILVCRRHLILFNGWSVFHCVYIPWLVQFVPCWSLIFVIATMQQCLSLYSKNNHWNDWICHVFLYTYVFLMLQVVSFQAQGLSQCKSPVVVHENTCFSTSFPMYVLNIFIFAKLIMKADMVLVLISFFLLLMRYQYPL